MTALGLELSFFGKAARFARGLIRGPKVALSRRRPFAVVAHRGAADAPPNSVEACRLAIERGADGVEVDLCVTADGVGVLWHDRDPSNLISLARQIGMERMPYVPRVPEFGDDMRRLISQLTLEEFQGRYGYIPRETSSVIPAGASEQRNLNLPNTLREFAAWAANEPRAKLLILDCKLVPAELDRVADLVRELDELCVAHPQLAQRQMHLLTVHLEVYECLARELRSRAALACVRLTPDFELPGVVEVSRKLGARHVCIGQGVSRLWTAVRLDVAEAVRARSRGELSTVGVWTINDPAVLRELVKHGVDYVLTDNSPRALEIVSGIKRFFLDRESRRQRARLETARVVDAAQR